MSASIHWRPISDDECLMGGSGGTVIDPIKAVFGEFPLDLTRADIEKLEIIAKLKPGVPEFRELIEIIQRVGAIHLYAIY